MRLVAPGLMKTDWQMLCCKSKKPKQSHECFQVGPVVHGKPVESFNRTVIQVPRCAGEKVLTGSCTAVSAGGGKFQNVVCLGRVTVAVVEHLVHIMEKWIE